MTNYSKFKQKNQKQAGYIRWKCKTLWIKGNKIPIQALSTQDLIQELNRLRAKSNLTTTSQDRQKMKYLSWVITWRNRKPEYLPKDLRYNTEKWSLTELSEFNYPKNVHELSLLYRIAILRGSIAHINLLHDILLTYGFIYKPSTINSNEEWSQDRLIPIHEYLNDQDSQILINRKLDSKLINPKTKKRNRL